jgi:catechol 1,2-dioxygenase
MIVSNERELTEQVLDVMERTPDPRFREIMTALIRHLHGFVRDVRLTEDEFREALTFIASIGQQTTDSHNEAVLMAGSLGVSSLVCLLNSGDGETESSASLLGPFWRMNSPKTENGGSLIRSPTPGPPFVFTGHVRNRKGQPLIDAEVDVWHCSTAGFYDVQDSQQADMNLRGKFTTDETGTFAFRSIKPVGYPIPAGQNVVGQLLRAQGRHCLRPAHVHVLIFKPGLKTLISQVFMPDDPHIDDDVQFGVTRNLIGALVRHDEPAPGGPELDSPWYSLEHTFTMDDGEATLPTPPIK